MHPPTDITLPTAGSTTARSVLGRYLQQTLALLRRLPAGRFGTRAADDFERLRAIVVELIRTTPGAAFAVLRRPTVAALVRSIDTELWARGDVSRLDSWLVSLNGSLALELAGSALLPEAGVTLRKPPRSALASGPRLQLDLSEERTITFHNGRVELPSAGRVMHLDFSDASLWPTCARLGRPYADLFDGVSLGLADNNPLRNEEAHPDKSGNTLSLGGRPTQDWVSGISQAVDLIGEYLPELREEFSWVLQLIIPTGYDSDKHLSASFREAVGMIYCTLHPHALTMAEGLIHEFSHNKLNALISLQPLFTNSAAETYPSPFRPDPRPLQGVLLAVHAFTPVARLYQKMRDGGHPESQSAGFQRRQAELIAKNHAGVATLNAAARTTPFGATLLEELNRWDRHFQN